MFFDRFWWFEGPGVSKSNSACFFTPRGIFWRSGELWRAPRRQIYSPKMYFLKFGVLKIKFLVILKHLRVRHARHRIAEKKLVCAISRKLGKENIFQSQRCWGNFDAGAISVEAGACIYCMHLLHSYIAFIYCMHILAHLVPCRLAKLVYYPVIQVEVIDLTHHGAGALNDEVSPQN